MRLLLALVLGLGSPALAQDVASARLVEPTDRYDHAVLGDALEWGGLEMGLSDGRRVRVTLPPTDVFEDVTARVGDFDGDGRTEVMVVQSALTQGAQLAIYDATGKRAATPYIGQRNRWLAPVGWGDLDGDGRIEIAYVDRPHLARELVILRLDGTTLDEIARAPGFTNHRIGDSEISGGVRRCDGRELVLIASADWSRRLAVRLDGARITAQDLGPWQAADSLTCP